MSSDNGKRRKKVRVKKSTSGKISSHNVRKGSAHGSSRKSKR